MLQLLKVEWLKVKHYKAFWIFLGLYVIGLFSINYIAYYFQVDLKKEIPLELFPYGFPKVWQTVAWISSWLLFFPGMLMILLVTNEFTFRTHRQNIIDGLTRSQFISVKLVIAFLLALIITIVVVINATVFGLLFGSTFKFEGFIYIPYAFIQSFTYILFALFLAFIMRRSGLALAVFFLYGFIFENLLMGLIGNYISEKGKYFLPLQTSDTLVPMPFGKTVIYRQAPEDLTLIIATLIYMALYILITYKKFNTEDL